MRKNLGLIITLLMYGLSGFSQTRDVTGQILDDKGAPVQYATIAEAGTRNVVTADANGKFSIKTTSNPRLTVSAAGFVSQTLAVLGNTLNITLKDSNSQLDEVVVTALGIGKERRTLGYSVQTINPDQIRSSQEPNLVNALAGKIAGVQINNSGGQAGSSSRIIIRGNTSLTGNNQPLFVIDGIPVDNSSERGIDEDTESALFNGYGANRAIDIDPNTIESTTVLKGAAATALYGSRGAFGVILITTKKGKVSSERKFPRVTFSSSASFDEAFTDGYQTTYLQGLVGLYKNGFSLADGGYSQAAGGATQTSGSWGPHKDSVSQQVMDSIGMPVVIDPRKQFYRTGKVLNNSITLSGGSDKTTYSLTYSNLTQEGIVINNDFKRNSIKASVSSQISQRFYSTTSINYINSKNNRFSEGNGARSYLYSLNFQPINFDAEKAYNERGNYAWTASNNFTTGFNNPYWLVNNNSTPSIVDRIILSNESTAEILPWLKLTNRVGLDTYTDEQREQVNINTISVPNGRMYDALSKRRQINNDIMLIAEKNLGRDWKLSGLIGHNVNTRTFSRRTVRGLGLSIPEFFDITNAEITEALQDDTRRRLLGVYASATAEYKNYLFLNATARNDWSSTLPPGDNSFFYPSISLGFVFSEALKLESTAFPYGKLRVSYAQAGNDAPEYFTSQTFIQANPNDGTRGNIAFPFNGINAFRANGLLANNNLKPEIVTEVEVGADLRFFNNRLGLDVSYYDKVSKSQVLDQEIAASSGYLERVTNAGELSNKGIEVVLTGSPVKSKSFQWDFQVNFAKNTYKLKSIAEGVDNIFLGGFTSPQIRADSKFGYGVIWGVGYRRNEQGQIVIGDDGLPLPSTELGPIGNATPDWTAGFRNTFRYKGLGFSVLFDAREGGDILNFDMFYSVFYGTAKITEQRNTNFVWQGVNESDGKPNTKSVFRNQDYWRNFYSAEIFENFIEDGSFIKLREITLSYALPQKLVSKTKLEGLSFYVTGRNLWIKSDFSYKDPEGNLLGNTNAQGFYHAVTPGTRGITVGLNVNF